MTGDPPRPADPYDDLYPDLSDVYPGSAPLPLHGEDVLTASDARVWNHLLGGSHHFAADATAAARLAHDIPGIRSDARANHAFRRRAVDYQLDRGVRQFLDLGCGFPDSPAGLRHLIHGVDPYARIVFADHDRHVIEHLRLHLEPVHGVAVLHADLRHPDTLLTSTEVLDLIDLTQPVALLATAVLQCLPPEDEPGVILAAYRDALTPGSALILSHPAPTHLSPHAAHNAARTCAGTIGPWTWRTPEQIAGLFDGWYLVPPPADGAPRIGPVTAWNPDPAHPDVNVEPGARTFYGGVGIHTDDPT